MRRAADAGSLLLLSGGVLLTVWIGIGVISRRPHATGGGAAFATVVMAIVLTAIGQYYQVLGLWRPLLWADVYGREADVLMPVRQWVQPSER